MGSRRCVAKAFKKDSRGGPAGTAATTDNGRRSICELQRRTLCHGRDPLHDSGPSRSDPSWDTGMEEAKTMGMSEDCPHILHAVRCTIHREDKGTCSDD